MNRIGLLKNIVKEYSWGSYTAIPKLLGKRPPYDKPQAEVWIGANISASSMVKTGSKWEVLKDLIDKYPDEILGRECTKNYGGQLPFLFKIIAASEPLSIQAHPNRTWAKEGFNRESKLGIPLDSFRRNYKDENHKPECVCALTGFEALCGFRGVHETILLLEKACPGTLKKQINELKNDTDPSGLKSFFTSVMIMHNDRKKRVVSEAFRNAGIFADENPAFKWVSVIAGKYPSDIGAIAPLFLNYIYLEPGQAMFIQTGQIHTYLEGVALELMADSDNVIRGGLTPKHVDVRELLNIVKFKQLKTGIILPEKNRNESIYGTPAGEFVLSAINVTNSETYTSPEKRSVEIILCIEGRAVIAGSENDKLNIAKGKSVIIPASVKKYSISGKATLYKASVPLLKGL